MTMLPPFTDAWAVCAQGADAWAESAGLKRSAVHFAAGQGHVDTIEAVLASPHVKHIRRKASGKKTCPWTISK